MVAVEVAVLREGELTLWQAKMTVPAYKYVSSHLKHGAKGRTAYHVG